MDVDDNGHASLSLEFLIPKKGIKDIAGNKIKELFKVNVILGNIFSKGQDDIYQWVRVSGAEASDAKVSNVNHCLT